MPKMYIEECVQLIKEKGLQSFPFWVWPNSRELHSVEVVVELGLEAIGFHLVPGTSGSNLALRAANLAKGTNALLSQGTTIAIPARGG